MTRVDFYVLGDDSGQARLTLACRLAEKAHAQAHRIYVHASSAAEAARLDDLLWTFRDVSFVPHALAGPPAAEPPPVLIGHEAADVHGFLEIGNVPISLLINLSDVMPPGYERFTRVAEVLDANVDRRRLGRDRFRQYRERGCALETHRL